MVAAAVPADSIHIHRRTILRQAVVPQMVITRLPAGILRTAAVVSATGEAVIGNGDKAGLGVAVAVINRNRTDVAIRQPVRVCTRRFAQNVSGKSPVSRLSSGGITLGPTDLILMALFSWIFRFVFRKESLIQLSFQLDVAKTGRASVQAIA